MRAPRFWFRNPGLVATLLRPLGAVYGWLTARRMARTGERVAVPVISVGNINAGGTGKTPVVIALAQMLAARNVAAHVVSRGHGGSFTSPLRVNERHHHADAVGDEPLLLSAFAPAWIARDRAAGARAAVADGAGALILDDAHQNPGLAKDLSLVVVDAAVGFGNRLCIPAGPLRESVAAGLARADAVVVIGPPDERAAFIAAEPGVQALPVLEGELRPLPTGMPWQGLKVMAFAGIGRPEKMFATLRALGADVVRTVPLDDHQPLSLALMQRLESEAQALGARLVTTEKDAMRLPQRLRASVLTLPVRLEFSDPAAVQALLAGVLATPGPAPATHPKR
ncbi:MAG: tetraacyldisaccharide 4'-kinase [Rubellimicrobium sp.]|nr:tetraacyldisaccharide 4'-kinase [Rubellimicrobium sp.]